ncbi:hypothetical protein [Allomesorhizobium alhagi]|uniref:Uncharacterized protein n=1 Tax=Mesorhizobium alhagi CCNWXJ12-2 TaxID=1107882 RepID=H0HP84_9HYPH|nr:hypothetical protein [Mesorhizobium alhagi]EHK57470.1 hypothetical protein MAXJ12_09808 [Mesorhizobium alhagi CCNWXJ12-2]
MDDKLYRATRIRAAEAQKSLSRYIADKLREDNTDGTQTGARNPQLEAIERILAGPMWDVTENGRMPTREERNARR